MMAPLHFKMALATIRGSKLRSLLTMLGIIIGVTSVVMSVALAQGIRKEASNELNQLGDTFITVLPSNPNDQSVLDNININSGLGNTSTLSTLTETDAQSIATLPGITAVAPLMTLSGSLISDTGTIINSGQIIITSADLPLVLQKELAIGSFFSPSESARPFVVLGSSMSEKLYGNETPLGSKLTIRGQEFTVVGVLKEQSGTSLNFGPNLDNSVFVPTSSAKALSGADARFQSIYITAADAQSVNEVSKQIELRIQELHGGEQDFAVIKQDDALTFTDNISRVITTGTAMIMSISLLVAGVGIMNIMLVSVTERTREIGIRKAVGATNRQILQQFFIEALVLSTLGGLVGLMISVLASFAITAYTDITLVVQPILIAVALGVSVGIGALFGVIPALQAARKDPIDALRNE